MDQIALMHFIMLSAITDILSWLCPGQFEAFVHFEIEKMYVLLQYLNLNQSLQLRN